MITREELRSIPRLYKIILRDREHLEYLEEKATSIPSILPDPNKVQTSPSNNANRYSDAAIDLSKEITVKESELNNLRSKAEKIIDAMPKASEMDRLSIKIMRKRYLNCMTWDEIADVLGYDVSYIQKLERLAIAALSL